MLDQVRAESEPAIDLTASVPTQGALPRRRFSYDVAIVGLGYVGLPTALAFQHAGQSVVGVDIDVSRLTAIRADDVDLLPSDHERLHDALDTGGLELSAMPDVISHAETVIVCVPTPVDHHLVPDLRALRGACASVVQRAVVGQVIVLTSTTYVGTTQDLLVRPLEGRGFLVGTDISVAFSPERIDPGNSDVAQEDVPRVVGGVTPRCARRAADAIAAYANSVHIVSSCEAAELTKLYENTFRAVNIALVNELADVSHELDVEIMEVIEAAQTKPYGFMPFTPGPGVGGHCIPCDPHYLIWQLKRSRVAMPLVEQAMTSIAGRPRHVVERAAEVLGAHGKALAGSSVLVVGVTYKPGVADIRESPAVEICERLCSAGAEVAYVDPYVPMLALQDGVTLRHVADVAVHEADLVILHTVHPDVDHQWVAERPIILDATYRFRTAPHRVTL